MSHLISLHISSLLLGALLLFPIAASADEREFQSRIKPLLAKYCLRCHNEDEMKSGVRLDRFDGKLEDRHLRLWTVVQTQVDLQAMPPEDEKQPTDAERELLLAWIQNGLQDARNRERPNNGTIRRLTVSQYRNTLRDLLGVNDNFADILPPDGVSKEGFANNGKTLSLSPLLVEAYFDIAEKGLNAAIVDEGTKPAIQNFRMDLGENINAAPFPDRLILGANSLLLPNSDFVVKELDPQKPFSFTPFRMRKEYRFHEGYQGNATVRGWREYDSIYHAVFACMRGNRGYPLGQPYESAVDGLLLRPAIPSLGYFGQSSTYGPQANFKIALRELPHKGRFRVTVRAARYDDALLLAANDAPLASDESVAWNASSDDPTLAIAEAGIYQVDVRAAQFAKNGMLTIRLGNRKFSAELKRNAKTRQKRKSSEDAWTLPFMVVRLPAGEVKVSAEHGKELPLRELVFTRLHPGSDRDKRFRVFEQRTPFLGVLVGLRRDCGHTLTHVGPPQRVRDGGIASYTFEDAIANYPSPNVEKNNDNYLAGVREIAVRHEYIDGRQMPRLRIESVEFEGPFYESWPPESHRRIFIDSPKKAAADEAYASEVIRSFAKRAFRRPPTAAEVRGLVAVWKASFKSTRDFQQSVKDALLVALTSPQFLFIIENSNSPRAEPLDDFELASKLSYFLWNSPPDAQLLALAERGKLRESIDSEFDRLIQDDRFDRCLEQFVSQWLSLDKLDVVETDHKRYPKLSREVKRQLRREPVETIKHLIANNLPLENLLRSDEIVANDVVATYYGLGSLSERGFEFAALKHQSEDLGGVLSQAGILAGLSDGRESNPIKRGAWLARKIIAKPPADPPPNVPELDDDDASKLTLRQRLEKHRNQEGCRKCHTGIDPWGIPFEQFDAGGLRKTSKTEATSTLPDSTEVANLNELKGYLASEMLDQVAFSLLKHLSTYANGRSLGYREIELLKEKGLQLKPDGYRLQDVLRFVVKSDAFLSK